MGEVFTFSLALSKPGGGEGVVVTVLLYTILGNVLVLTRGEQRFDLDELLFCERVWRCGYE